MIQRGDTHSNKLKELSKYFKLSHLNTQSMTSSFDEFQVALKEHALDGITLSEAWLKNSKYLLDYLTIPASYFICHNRDG